MTWKELRNQFQTLEAEPLQHEVEGSSPLNSEEWMRRFQVLAKSTFPILERKIGTDLFQKYILQFSKEIDLDSFPNVSQFFYFPIWFQQNVKDNYLQKLVEWEWIQTSLMTIDWDLAENRILNLQGASELYLNSSVQFFKMPALSPQDFPVGLWCFGLKATAGKVIQEMKLDKSLAFIFEEMQESPGLTMDELEEVYADFFEEKLDRKKITRLIEDGWVRAK